MSGLYSRNKGRRGEYALRDYLRLLGYEVDRVPLSGASQGFKGDLRVRKDGHEEFIEVKVRANSFGSVYAGTYDMKDYTYFNFDGECVLISKIFDEVFPVGQGYYYFSEPFLKQSAKRVLSLKKLLGGCNILAIKDDRKPWIFIRYY